VLTKYQVIIIERIVKNINVEKEKTLMGTVLNIDEIPKIRVIFVMQLPIMLPIPTS
jgi:hypothetical protein